MGKTLLELFKGSPQDKSVKSDKETLVEQELTGVRTKSAVEINNPLIYGNEATRIAQRSTPDLEKMKKGELLVKITMENKGFGSKYILRILKVLGKMKKSLRIFYLFSD